MALVNSVGRGVPVTFKVGHSFVLMLGLISNIMRPGGCDMPFKTNDKCKRVHNRIIDETNLHSQSFKTEFYCNIVDYFMTL
jgi:hypothetical protein